jgi:CYTH domain-containing protein
MGLEIERKFLVTGDEWKRADSVLIQQGYLSSNKDRIVRIRTIADKSYITIKGLTNGISRSEFEYEIPFKDATELLDICETPIIRKYRYNVQYSGRIIEVDEFLDLNKGLVIAEIELNSENDKTVLPTWIGEEVSSDPRYFNSNLIINPYCNWNDTDKKLSSEEDLNKVDILFSVINNNSNNVEYIVIIEDKSKDYDDYSCKSIEGAHLFNSEALMTQVLNQWNFNKSGVFRGVEVWPAFRDWLYEWQAKVYKYNKDNFSFKKIEILKDLHKHIFQKNELKLEAIHDANHQLLSFSFLNIVDNTTFKYLNNAKFEYRNNDGSIEMNCSINIINKIIHVIDNMDVDNDIKNEIILSIKSTI